MAPHAQGWHERDELIPDQVVEAVAGLGVFGLTVPEAHGGLGLGKAAMCVVTEELSRGYIGVGSLGTRSEIAAELIRAAGTEAQKKRYLPKIAAGEILPTAVFTEPNTGSDLAALQTRAVLDGERYRVSGAKIWITHAARADLMTILCRTDPAKAGYRGLSILLAEKPRGSDADAVPGRGPVGRRDPGARLPRHEGVHAVLRRLRGAAGRACSAASRAQGFKQLMATFESARIQTAARAVGVAQSALELGLAYARERVQFGKPIYAFPRVADKLVWMAVEIMIARQLTLFAAREKDAERRCDLEAGMAKLLAAQVAFERRRQRAADPRRQRLRARVPDQPGVLRRAHPQHLRGRRRDPGPGHRPPPARRLTGGSLGRPAGAAAAAPARARSRPRPGGSPRAPRRPRSAPRGRSGRSRRR